MIKIKEELSKIYSKESFQPSVLIGPFLNIAYLPRKALFKFIQNNAMYITGNILDVGCGSKPYKNLFKFEKYIGVDVQNEGHSHNKEDIDYFYDGKVLPFENNSFDNAVCFEVLEHVFEPDLFLSEINRVLKRGGNLLLTTPFIWNEHEIPNDYGRYSSYGLTYLMKKNGFQVTQLVKTLNGPEFFIVLLQVYITDFRLSISEKIKLIPKIRLILFLIFMPFMILFNFLGLISSLFPRDDKFYYNNGLLLKKN